MRLLLWFRQLHTHEGGFLLPAAIGLMAGQLFGGGGGGGGRSAAAELTPEQRELLDIQKRRLLASDPLYNAIIQLAMQLLPGGGSMRTLPPADGGPSAGEPPALTLPELPERPGLEGPRMELALRAAGGGTPGAGIFGLDRLAGRYIPGYRQAVSRAQLDAAAQAAARAATTSQAQRARFGPQLAADLAAGAGWGNLPGGVGELAQIRAESRERGARIDELMKEMVDQMGDVPAAPGGPELY